jgi:predicted RNA binding protein YcfA (HicA-like mRNA interferase family)
MKIRDIMAVLRRDGWYQVVQRGSHRQFKHPVKKGRVTIAGHRNDGLAPGTLNSILEQAGLKESD